MLVNILNGLSKTANSMGPERCTLLPAWSLVATELEGYLSGYYSPKYLETKFECGGSLTCTVTEKRAFDGMARAGQVDFSSCGKEIKFPFLGFEGNALQ